MKRILHIPNFYSPHIGGIEDVCKTIVDVLNTNKEFEQKIICFNDSSKRIIDIYNHVEVIRVGVWKKVASQSIAFSYFRLLKGVISSFKPDYIHFHAPNPFVALSLILLIPKPTKLIVHWHSDIIDQKLLYLLIKPIETLLLKKSYKIITTSDMYKDYSIVLNPFLHKVVVIQNTINHHNFQLNLSIQSKIDEIKLRYKNRKIILFVGRHVPYKGLEYLLQATIKVQSDVVFLIGGYGTLTDQLKKQNKLKKVYFLGRIDDEDLAAYYYAADIFVFPSITKNEAFGLALAEAMYCKTPGITFTIPGSGVNWVNLNGVTGIEVTNSDSEELSKAIDFLISNPEIREIYANNAKQRIQRLFVIDKIADKIVILYS